MIASARDLLIANLNMIGEEYLDLEGKTSSVLGTFNVSIAEYLILKQLLAYIDDDKVSRTYQALKAKMTPPIDGSEH